MIKKKFLKIGFLGLLIKTLSFINKKSKRKLFNLIILVFFQACFDVLNLASIIPLIQLLTDKNKLQLYIEKSLSIINSEYFFISDNSLISIYIPLIVILIMVLTTIVRLYVVYFTFKFIEETRHQICSKLMEGFINRDIGINKNSSEIAKSILSEVDQFIILVFEPTILMLTNVLVLLAIIGYLLFTNPYPSLVSLGLLIFFYINFYFFSKRKLNIEGYRSEKSNKGRFITAIEVFKSIKDIKIYSAEKYFSNRFKRFSRIFANTNATYSTLVASPKYLLEMIVLIALAISILFISLNKIADFNSLPLLGIFAFAAYKAQPALSNVIYGINSIEYGSKIISNLNKELKRANSKEINLKYKAPCKMERKLKSKKSLVIKNLNFIFNGKNEGIKKVNLTIENPTLFVLYGSSGSGKSTLLNLISGILKPQEGEIKYFNNNKPSIPKISYLHQEHTLFDATIAENVAFGIPKEEINYSDVKKALMNAEIYDYVNSLEEAFNEKVGEDGSNLSIGQKQRIALARALYFKPDILLLDEPTSALDHKNEKKIINTLLRLSKNIMVIMSTHKIDYLPENTKVGYLKNNRMFEKEINDLI